LFFFILLNKLYTFYKIIKTYVNKKKLNREYLNLGLYKIEKNDKLKQRILAFIVKLNKNSIKVNQKLIFIFLEKDI